MYGYSVSSLYACNIMQRIIAFAMKVGLHQGSAINMGELAYEIDTEPPCVMLFADDLEGERERERVR